MKTEEKRRQHKSTCAITPLIYNSVPLEVSLPSFSSADSSKKKRPSMSGVDKPRQIHIYERAEPEIKCFAFERYCEGRWAS